ncbi:MAG: dTMP kinase, partial [Deltaproteobacteria bacterium]
GRVVTLTREPGGTTLAEKLRAMVLNDPMDAMTEALLVFAARRDHLRQVIEPALAKGHVVLCDRFTDATIAYQGHGRQLDLLLIEQLNLLATTLVRPQLTILLDCPVEVGLGRAMARISSTTGAKEERFEQESVLFHNRVRNGYLQLATAAPDRFIIINGDGNIKEVHAAIASAVLPRLAGGAGSCRSPIL